MRVKSEPAIRPDAFLLTLQQKVTELEVVKEHRFHPVRKWRFDYAIPSVKVAVEVDGGVWTGGRHINPQGYINDMDKLNTAASMGWLVLRITTDDRFTTKALDMIRNTIEYRRTSDEKY